MSGHLCVISENTSPTAPTPLSTAQRWHPEGPQPTMQSLKTAPIEAAALPPFSSYSDPPQAGLTELKTQPTLPSSNFNGLIRSDRYGRVYPPFSEFLLHIPVIPYPVNAPAFTQDNLHYRSLLRPPCTYLTLHSQTTLQQSLGSQVRPPLKPLPDTLLDFRE
jgi:hypothetical protein